MTFYFIVKYFFEPKQVCECKRKRESVCEREISEGNGEERQRVEEGGC